MKVRSPFSMPSASQPRRLLSWFSLALGAGGLTPPRNQTAPCPVARFHPPATRMFELPSRKSMPPTPLERIKLPRLLRTEKIANYTIAYTSYAAGEPYSTTQKMHVKTARKVGGVDRTFPWSRAQLLQTAWGEKHLRFFYSKFSKHARWVWKPYVIWDALQRVEDGDFVVYMDASRFFKKGFTKSVIPLTNFLYANRRGAVDPSRLSFGMVPGLRLKERNRSHWFWPLKCALCEILAVMGLCASVDDDACCRHYWDAPHVQASFSVWQKNPLTLQFVRTWLTNCQDLEVIRRSKQGDQCVSTLIAIAYSKGLGLKVPWIQIPNIPNGNKLKDPDLLFGAFARSEPPPFLRHTDPYPECVKGTADEYFMCS